MNSDETDLKMIYTVRVDGPVILKGQTHHFIYMTYDKSEALRFTEHQINLSDAILRQLSIKFEKLVLKKPIPFSNITDNDTSLWEVAAIDPKHFSVDDETEIGITEGWLYYIATNQEAGDMPQNAEQIDDALYPGVYLVAYWQN